MAVTPIPRRILRVLSWHRRKLAAALTVVGVLLALHAIGPQGPPTVAVLVTTDPVPAGHRLTTTDVELRQLPEAAVPAEALSDPDDVVGRLGTADLPAGQVLTRLSTVSERQAGPGRVIAPLRLADADLARLLSPGEQIDVVAADPETGRSSVVVSGVRVVTVPQAGVSTSGPLGATSTASGVLCLVSVARDDAATLAGAAAGQLSVVWSGG